MAEKNCSIILNHLTAGEYFGFPDHFKEYSQAVIYMFNISDVFIPQEVLIDQHKDDPFVQHLVAGGTEQIEAITKTFPDRFISVGSRKIQGQDHYIRAWVDLWGEYEIVRSNPFYDLFLTYKLRHTDLLEIDNLLNCSQLNYSDNKKDFIRFLRLTLRKHGKKLLQPEQEETINEWITEQEKEITLFGNTEVKTKGKPKRDRDDKLTCLNQEQTALLIYCLRETKIILKDELLNNKEAGQAFSALTGYSADTIRQNLNKSEVARLATSKNIDAVTKAINDLNKFIENQIKPE